MYLSMAITLFICGVMLYMVASELSHYDDPTSRRGEKVMTFFKRVAFVASIGFVLVGLYNALRMYNILQLLLS